MRFAQLRYLEAALRTGSFRQAAKELNVSQPTITNQVQRLEEDIGVVLVTRGAKGVQPTYAAHRILPHVVAAVQAEKMLRAEASAIGGLKLGTVRLGTVPAGSQTVLARTVKKLLTDYPNVQFEVDEGPSDKVFRGVLSGHFDVGLVTRLRGLELRAGENTLVDYVDLVTGRLVLSVPEGHPIANKDVLDPDDLIGEPLIFPVEASSLRAAWHRLLDGREANVVYSTPSAEASQAMVRSGVGICMANTLLDSTVSGDGVVLVPLPFEWAHATTSAILRKNEARSSAVQTFLRLLRETAKEF